MFWQIGLGYLLLGKKLAPIQVGGPYALFSFGDVKPNLMLHLLIFPNQMQTLERLYKPLHYLSTGPAGTLPAPLLRHLPCNIVNNAPL